MTYRLHGLRGVLERAKLVLEGRADADATRLAHDVANVLSGISLIEAADARGVLHDEHAPRVLSTGQALVERVRAYCSRHRLRFLVVETPSPDKSMSRSDVLALLLEMRSGDTLPPPELQAALREDQNMAHDTIPSPAPPAPETLQALPGAGDDECE